MPESLIDIARVLREALRGFEPEALSGDHCARLAEELARTEKVCAAAGARAAARAADAGAHRRRGYANPVGWLARTTGTSGGQARAALETVATLKKCPLTAEALTCGELSMAQGAEIATTEAVCPGSEAEFVKIAKKSSLGVLRERARSRRLKAKDPKDLHDAQHAARELRHWQDGQGMVRLSAALPPELGVPIVNRIEAEAERIRRQVRRKGKDERRSAHRADALVKFLSGEGKASGTRTDLVVVWQRPPTTENDAGEGQAHVLGGGPIPVSLARRLAEGAFVKAVIHDGVRIDTVAHIGRYIPVALRTALELGDPPGFEGMSCVDCGSRLGLQRDHVNPVANGGITAYDNMAGRCWDCHEMKTEADRKAGLLGANANSNGNGNRRAPP